MNELLPFDKNSYLNFDAVSLKSLILDRLNKGKVFTDQNYQGSNLSAIIDVISMVFGNLLFYLNKTSSESMFSETSLYENMNKIVKLLNYNPVGKTSATVPIRIIAGSSLLPNNYTIPRYSYVNVGSTIFSFTSDTYFSKLILNENEEISSLSDKVLLKQGVYEEYPVYTSTGFDNEIIYLSLDEDIFVDHYSIDVYVKDYGSNQWVKYTAVNELFLHTANETVYQLRFNENKRYEIIFGNDINGKKLNLGDQVLIYYLRIDAESNVSIGTGGLNNQFIVRYNSLLYPNVLEDTNSVNANYLSINDLRNVFVNNAYPSTDFKNEETVDDIRRNAPQNFRSQYRLTTKIDYESYIKNNFSDLIRDVKIFNNNEYLMNYMKYLYDIGLSNPGKELNLLFNQVKFSNACNFNNLYFCSVPKSKNQSFLNPPQKEMILNQLDKWKILTTEIVPLDPVYMMFDFYVPTITNNLSLDELVNTKLRIFKSRTTTLSDSMIISKIINIFNDAFLHENCTLGEYVDINKITTNILSLDDVKFIKTINTKTNEVTDGISLLCWNYYYPGNDKKVYTQNVILDEFKFPVFNDLENISKKIEIYNETFEVEATQF
jgi:hypothetical protein